MTVKKIKPARAWALKNSSGTLVRFAGSKIPIIHINKSRLLKWYGYFGDYKAVRVEIREVEK